MHLTAESTAVVKRHPLARSNTTVDGNSPKKIAPRLSSQPNSPKVKNFLNNQEQDKILNNNNLSNPGGPGTSTEALSSSSGKSTPIATLVRKMSKKKPEMQNPALVAVQQPAQDNFDMEQMQRSLMLAAAQAEHNNRAATVAYPRGKSHRDSAK